jgi:hypothetical protein
MVTYLHDSRCNSVRGVRKMLVSKLLDGVIVVEQRASRRAFRPKFAHRIMLSWTFRNFTSLPILVLANWQKAVITAIVADGVVVSVPSADSGMIIGIVENVPMAGAAIVNKKPVTPALEWEYSASRPAGNRVSA